MKARFWSAVVLSFLVIFTACPMLQAQEPCEATFDLNNDGISLDFDDIASITLSTQDAAILLNWLDGGGSLGPFPWRADLNLDCKIDYADYEKFQECVMAGPFGCRPIGGGFYPTCCNPDTTRPSCCIGVVGNLDGDLNEQVDLADLQCIVDKLFFPGIFPPPCDPCPEEADMSGDGAFDISDVQEMIDYLFMGGQLRPCP